MGTERKAAAVALTAAALFFAAAPAGRAQADPRDSVKHVVDATIRPLMAKNNIPGMAVGVVVDGRSYVFDYGLASKEAHQPVANDTLFEIGSVSKTFLATLASCAQSDRDLALSDPVSKYFPLLQGTAFGNLTLLNLGTHTTGGMPLQVPDGIDNDDQLLAYLKTWQPPHPPGTYRAYSNVSIGTLGLIVAKSMNGDFATLMERRVFAPLDLHDTYINVPSAKMADYAQGYKRDGTPIRMAPGELWTEAYGVRTTAADLLRFIAANENLVPVDDRLRGAILQTHTGYFDAGAFTQDLVWAQYPYPLALQRLLDGNAVEVTDDPSPVTALNPPRAPVADALLDKTGSTNGFGTYVAFVPAKRLGIVLLANKNYPIPERITAAYAILSGLSARR